MSALQFEVRAGAYYDSIVLMRLQAGLAAEEGVLDCGAVMATEANLALLAASGLRPTALPAVAAEDLLIVVSATTEAAGDAALARTDALLARRHAETGDDDYRPRSLATALKQAPEAQWVTVSLPGRYAADVVSEALTADRHVFLYSDNVDVEDERALKQRARDRGCLVMGPDCGTAIIGGVGMGFANRVEAGPVGLVAASGTGLQTVATSLARAGIGISQAIGTGGRDLGDAVGGITTRQALGVLSVDDATRLIVLISKPPSPAVARQVLAAAWATDKPVVVCFLGLTPPVQTIGRLCFVAGLEAAADQASAWIHAAPEGATERKIELPVRPGFVRGLFAGGTLAYEALLQLRLFASPLFSNTPIEGVGTLSDPTRSEGHTILDMGADEYTVGRLHPMIDPDLRLRRLRQEAADPAVSTILLDVVLGDGAEADPAARLAPEIDAIRAARPEVAVHVMVLGTDDDPQEPAAQRAALAAAGATVHQAPRDALAAICRRLLTSQPIGTPVSMTAFAALPSVINVGLADFGDAMRSQGADVVQVEWRPPAGGNDRLIEILKRMKGTMS